MSKKKPRSKDPHSWIKDTSKMVPESAAPEEEEEEEDESAPRRFVIVEYLRDDGRIIAAHEVGPDAGAADAELPASLSDKSAVARITLKGEMLDKSLLDLYENHRVDDSKSRPTIAPRA